jgi:hypothetical protein
MTTRTCLTLLLAAAILVPFAGRRPLSACCPAPPSGKPVVNADQSVILIWDAPRKTQHFIRRASFRGEAEDFGFLVPSPTQPVLAESGNDAFPYLQKLTEPKVEIRRRSGGGCLSCSDSKPTKDKDKDKGHKGEAAQVRVLDEQEVAGFKAAVLETTSAHALVAWLKENGYAYSPEVRDWAKPYVAGGWKITALKVAPKRPDREKSPADRDVTATALRLSFKTDRPLFPYREPDYKNANERLGKTSRLLRIYFVAEARYRGELTKDTAWTGKVAWANKLGSVDRAATLRHLALPEDTGPAQWWLTEFEDYWPYRVAPADVTFSPDSDQGTVERPPIIRYVSAPWPADVMTYAVAAAVILPPLLRRVRRARPPS